ncbi:MAG: helix-turn-helix transcriptional regulator [Croceibacterium sp.]
MAEIRKITHTQIGPAMDSLYERLLGSLAGGNLGAAVRGGVDALTAGARRIYLFEATTPDDDALRYCHCEPHIARLLPAYAERFKRLDPLRDIYSNATAPGTMALQRVGPADIGSAAFRRRFFEQPGIVERVSIVQRGKDNWRGVNLARHASDGPFSDRELDNLVALARLALPMLPLVARKPTAPALSAAELEERLSAHCPELTPRERQVCARAALGMSVEATGIALGVAKTTIVTFRQRAYRRLGVTSPFELLGLVAH